MFSELDGQSATYTIADVLKANAILDMRADLQELEQNKNKDSA